MNERVIQRAFASLIPSSASEAGNAHVAFNDAPFVIFTLIASCQFCCNGLRSDLDRHDRGDAVPSRPRTQANRFLAFKRTLCSSLKLQTATDIVLDAFEQISNKKSAERRQNPKETPQYI